MYADSIPWHILNVCQVIKDEANDDEQNEDHQASDCDQSEDHQAETVQRLQRERHLPGWTSDYRDQEGAYG